MTNEQVTDVGNMLASCAGVVVFLLSAILGRMLAKDLNWFKW